MDQTESQGCTIQCVFFSQTYCSIIPGAELSDRVPLLNLELNESSDPDKFPTILTDESEVCVRQLIHLQERVHWMNVYVIMFSVSDHHA